ncbi:MAG: replication-associated recombination protein A [Candidatus Gastranaerophilales bacterium]|nr:replication-associated recombination protein A [Candidatus Gastranaerophilales bacterium]
MSLFDVLEEQNKQIPLAETLRPKTLEDFLGQVDIIKQNSAVWNLLKSGRLFSLILWGPPGCGKTTLARIIAKEADSLFVELSAVSSGIKDIRETVETARQELRSSGKKTILFIDEIHRYNKTQQDALLPHIENGTIYLMGSTTENPSFQVIPALISRVQLLLLKPLDDENLLKIIRRGYKYLIDKYGKINLDPEIGEFIVKHSMGDARIALNMVETSYFASTFKADTRILTLETLESLVQKRYIKYGIQEHYDHASAFQKSLRGSDPDAAIYWLAKMISAGEDPRFIARRLIVTASEDVGNADPNALHIALNAHKAVEMLGLPEGRIPLAQAVIYIAKAPKFNQAIMAIDKALHDIEVNGESYSPPAHLKDSHYKDASKYGFGNDYVYSHEHPEIMQNFLPEEIKGRKYLE